MKNDDVIIIGRSKFGFNVDCECGERHFHELVSITAKCPKCGKKQKYKVCELPEFVSYLLKDPIFLTWIKMQTLDELKVHANDFNRQKQVEFIKGWEKIGLRSREVGFVESFNRNKGKPMQAYEFKLKKGLF